MSVNLVKSPVVPPHAVTLRKPTKPVTRKISLLKVVATTALILGALATPSNATQGRPSAQPADLSAPSWTDRGYDETPPCEYEDGSGQPRCVWDARHMGNGRGTSWLIIQGGKDNAAYIKITHRRAHRLFSTNR